MINLSKPKHLFYILLTVLLFPIIYLAVNTIFSEEAIIGTYGVNKTIGWAWDLCPSLPLFAVGSLFVATIGYLFLLVFKTRLNKWISILHLGSLAVVLAFLSINPSNYEWCDIRLKLTILSLGFLFANILFAIIYKLYIKNKRLEH